MTATPEAAGSNYIADKEQMPTTIWLACGRKIEIQYTEVMNEIKGGDAYLEITSEMHPALKATKCVGCGGRGVVWHSTIMNDPCKACGGTGRSR